MLSIQENSDLALESPSPTTSQKKKKGIQAAENHDHSMSLPPARTIYRVKSELLTGNKLELPGLVKETESTEFL